MNKLLPCPFCGSKANLDGNGTLHYVKCAKCGSVGVRTIDKDYAIEAWNTRIGYFCQFSRPDNENGCILMGELKMAKQKGYEHVIHCYECANNDYSNHCCALGMYVGADSTFYCAWGELRENV